MICETDVRFEFDGTVTIPYTGTHSYLDAARFAPGCQFQGYPSLWVIVAHCWTRHLRQRDAMPLEDTNF
eukprot:788849-Amphidinium_carterae.1